MCEYHQFFVEVMQCCTYLAIAVTFALKYLLFLRVSD